MDLFTRVEIPKSSIKIDHSSRLMTFGSCFSDNIGEKLLHSKFNLVHNPFGILFNPASIEYAIRRLLRGDEFTTDELVINNGLFHSFMHHGSFSNSNEDDCLRHINSSFDVAKRFIRQTDVLIVTFGTAYIYRLKSNNMVVSNCHKFPSSYFVRERLTVDNIVDSWRQLIANILEKNENLKILFAVSPIRHLRDGAHDNQISKSILHLSVDRLMHDFGDAVGYFPSYEIMLDELRDYRFYDSDMLHPSDVAIEYIWGKFSDMFFSRETMEIIKEVEGIQKSINHRPIHKNTEIYRNFLYQTKDKLYNFASRNPSIDCTKEMQMLERLLQDFDK
ncbi:MAG: GSCFA domain-containing protein [Fermentimonas sp.]|jgi:hypothetical protein